MSKKQGFSALSPEEHRAIARKGGLAVAQNRAHMAEIGRKGGIASGEVRGNKSKDVQFSSEAEGYQQTESGWKPMPIE